MSKYVKNLISDHLRQKLSGVNDALVVNMIGLKANTNYRLRTLLHQKKIRVTVVKNSLAARAVSGTPLAPMFDGVDGTSAICYGGEDIVSLAKEVTKLAKDPLFAPFAARGGVMDGQQLTGEQVADVATWPSRTEQLSILAGQILSPAANLASQLGSVGGALASQIEQRGKGEEGEVEAASEAAPAAAE